MADGRKLEASVKKNAKTKSSRAFLPRTRSVMFFDFNSHPKLPMALFDQAKELYASLEIDVEEALSVLGSTPISLHCWQGDDVGGFEGTSGTLGGGLAVTGNYPGKARTVPS